MNEICLHIIFFAYKAYYYIYYDWINRKLSSNTALSPTLQPNLSHQTFLRNFPHLKSAANIIPLFIVLWQAPDHRTL